MLGRACPGSSTPTRPAGAAVVSTSSAFPREKVATAEIEDRLGLARGWLVARTGVRYRFRATTVERLADLGAAAAYRALDQAAVRPDELDLILVATMTPRGSARSLASLIAHAIAAPQAGAIDIGAACSGFLSALALATGWIEARRATRVLVVGGDLMSRVVDQDDKVTAGIFGDGAGAVVVQAIEGPTRIGPCVFGSDGANGDAIVAARPAGPVRLDGHRTYRLAVDMLVEIGIEAARRADVAVEEIDLLVPHQANARITRAVGQRLGFSPDRVVDCIARYGNTTGGSVPTALAYAQADGRLSEGTVALIVVFGAGLTWAACVLTWGGVSHSPGQKPSPEPAAVDAGAEGLVH